MKVSFLKTFIRIYPFRGYEFAFVILNAAIPVSLLSNQFRKSRIYSFSRIVRCSPFRVTSRPAASPWQVREEISTNPP
jgi:hypothetical protein